MVQKTTLKNNGNDLKNRYINQVASAAVIVSRILERENIPAQRTNQLHSTMRLE